MRRELPDVASTASGLREVLGHLGSERTVREEGYVPTAAAPTRLGAVQGGPAAAVRVLVVDDESSIRLLCRVVLELDGCEVVDAASVGEARAAIAEGGVDVLVVDLNLRGERSVELVAECQAAQPRIPVVLVTGSVELGGEGTSEADVVLGKPFEPEELVAVVRRLAAGA